MAVKNLYAFTDDGEKVCVASINVPTRYTVSAIVVRDNNTEISGASNCVSGTGTYNSGDTCTLTAQTFSENGVSYTFLGWRDSPSNVPYNPANPISFTVTGDIIKYAVYSVVTSGGADR